MAVDLVAPLIPDAQKNRSPDLLIEGFTKGLAAFSQLAQVRRQAESDVAHLALQERMAQEQHGLEQQKLDLAADMLPYQKELISSQADLAREHARAYTDGTATAAQNQIRFNRQKEALFNEVNKTTQELQLDDPQFQTKEPMQFAANVMKFRDMYGLAPMSEIKGAIKKYQDIADSQKIVIRPNAIKDENGQWKTGEPRSVPIWKIAQNLQDPDAHEQTMNDLRASGHITETEESVPGKPSAIFGSWWPDAPTTKKIEKRSPAMERLLQNKTQFEHAPSRVPAVILPSSSGAGTAPTELPVDIPEDGTSDPQASAGKPPDYGPDIDALLENARAAIRRGAPMKAVAERLQSQFGVDPNQLWAT